MASLSIIRSQIESRLPGALSPYMPLQPEMLPTGIQALDSRTGGIPKSGLTQICAPVGVTSGRTTLLLALISAVTNRREFCALVDASDCFDPASADAARVDLSRLLWVRSESRRGMRPLEEAFRAADIVVHNGGFGLIVVDLGNIDERLVRKVPLATWFRFARVLEKMPTALVFLLSHPAAQSCAALTLHLSSKEASWQGTERVSHARFLSGIEFGIEIGRSRMRKPVQSAPGNFTANSIWA
jgi:recA bacterial DNA recombination protein